MPTTYKVLGQSAPSATTNTDIYTAPASSQAIVSTISVTNRAATEASFRIAIRPNGASISNQHYIAYDAKVPGNDSLFITVGVTVDADDVITVYASNASLSFSAFGSEIV